MGMEQAGGKVADKEQVSKTINENALTYASEGIFDALSKGVILWYGLQIE